MAEIASYKSRESVREGWQWLSGFRADPSYRENARALLSRWSYEKPGEVADVVKGIEDVEFQRALAEQVAAVWRERDLIAYRHWVASLPSGALRDSLANDSGG